MGSGSSKPKPEAPPQVVEPVNIMITKEVTERWAALSQKKLQNMQQETKTSADKEKRPSPAPADGVGPGSNLTPSQLQPMEGVQTGKEKVHELAESSDLPSIPNFNEPLESPASSKGDKEPGRTSPTDSGPTSAPAASVKVEEIVQNYDNMDKFANFLVPKDSTTLRYDLQNGNDIQDHLIDYETRYSAFLRKPNEPTSESSPLFDEEDEDETTGIKRKHSNSNFIDKEAFVSESHSTSGESRQQVKEIRVPKPALPVILDQDEDGTMTIETLKTWKLRERFEKEITKNNSYWTEELQRLTAKMEDEARAQSEDIQLRIANLNRKYADVVNMPFKNGPHCNLLVSDIGRCYEKNNDQVLKCNDLVRQFAKCTSKIV